MGNTKPALSSGSALDFRNNSGSQTLLPPNQASNEKIPSTAVSPLKSGSSLT